MREENSKENRKLDTIAIFATESKLSEFAYGGEKFSRLRYVTEQRF